MQTFSKILLWLSGKKGALASIVGAVNTYLYAKDVYGDLEAALVATISLVIFGGASYATSKLVYKK